MHKLTKLAVACVATALGLAANAAEFTLKSNLEPGFDWSLGSSYDGGNAPGTGDTIVVPSGMTATLSASDSTSFDFVSSRERVTPLGTFVVDVASGTATFDAAISLRGKANSAIGAGVFQKTGAGELQLTKYGLTEVEWGVTSEYSYDVNFLVSAGRVIMPQTLPDNNQIRNIVRNLDLSSGTLKCPWSGVSGKSCTLWITGGLTGDGTLEAVSETTAAETSVYYNASGHCTFSGKLTGGMSLQIQNGSIDFTGTESSIASTAKNGNVNVRSFTDKTNIVGFASFNNPGSFGGTLYVGGFSSAAPSHIRYLGNGETTSCAIGVSGTRERHILDGGSHGGLIMNGNISLTNPNNIPQTRFVLSGDHATPCEFTGRILNEGGNLDGLTYYFEKRGTGTWKIDDNTTGELKVRQNRGLWAICDGLLQYQSIAEAGNVCSLGLATDTYEHTDGSTNAAYATTYAIRIGSTNAADVACDPKFQYVGAANATVTTRPIGIARKGTLVSGTAAIDWTGVAPVGKDDATLILDGTDATGANTLRGVTDNAAGGKLSLTKRGEGTWTLDDEASLSGRVSVEDGTLAFNSDTSVPYKYYRLTLRETARNATRFDGKDEKSPSSQTTRIAIQRMGLFDEEGNWICSNLTYNADWTALQPGECAFQNPSALKAPANASNLYKWFLTESGNNYSFVVNSDITYANTNAHLQIVIRLRDADVGRATRFNLLYVERATDGYNWKTQPTAYTLEGSADGRRWTILDDRMLTTDDVDSALNYYWVQDHKAYNSAVGGGSFDPSERAGKGWEIATARAAAEPHVAMLDNAEIAVASNATIQAVGGNAIVNRIAVDCRNGAGTFSGITLAPTGTLALENVGDGYSVNVFTPENGLDVTPLSGWDFTVDGTASDHYKLVVKDGVVKVKKISGFTLIFR